MEISHYETPLQMVDIVIKTVVELCFSYVLGAFNNETVQVTTLSSQTANLPVTIKVFLSGKIKTETKMLYSCSLEPLKPGLQLHVQRSLSRTTETVVEDRQG